MLHALSRSHFLQALEILERGIESLVQEWKSHTPVSPNHPLQEMKNLHGFLDTLHRVKDSIPEDRIEEAMRHSLGVIQKQILRMQNPYGDAAKALHSQSSRTKFPAFLFEVCRQLGPTLRMGDNQMKAWVRIASGEAVFFSPESIEACLNDRGVTAGIDRNRIQEIFRQSLFDQEVLIAQGADPQAGDHGRIEWCLNLNEMSRVPKLLEDNRVSFKDIDLFQFVSKGQPLARKIPPVPGIPGYTVTGRILPCPKSQAAAFPRINNTIVSEDGTGLFAEIDGCITKRAGRIVLNPCLLVDTVSFETGNIQSNVSVVVRGNVLSGFSVTSQEDIHIYGIVEGAHLKSERNIVIKGGVQGKEKALLEAKGDVTAKYIANATVINEGNVLVETEIVQSRIWSGGRVVVSSNNGEIIGGEVDADLELSAATIGSGLGVKTIVRLGGQTNDLVALLAETQEKMSQQEEAVEKCRQIIESLEYQIARPLAPTGEMQKALLRAQNFLKEAQNNVGSLQRQLDTLSLQYDERLLIPRIVQARKALMPGTELDIQGAQMMIDRPTGPVQAIRQEEQLTLLPFQEPRSRNGDKSVNHGEG